MCIELTQRVGSKRTVVKATAAAVTPASAST